MSTLDLTGLPVNDAVLLARRRLDREFKIELVQLIAAMTSAGMSRDRIAGILEREHAGFVAWRREHLAELRAWILDCNRKLH